ncbi:hypothetical protein [Hoeflea sp. TYP-13]|uniref:hypothetical protein n=1 Tax=Hoeflea sp. TYP-13 TaxID=3230023 RepID=UPI0034C67132
MRLFGLNISISAAAALFLALSFDATAQNTTPVDNAIPLDLPGLTEFAPTGEVPNVGITSQQLRNVELDARLVEGSAPLEHGLVWRIYHPVPGQDGKLPILATSEGGSALISMEPGEYFVHVAFGLAGVTRKLTVPIDGPVDTQDFILNAGGLVLNAISGNDVRIAPAKLKFSIYSEERDANEQRQLIIADVRPNQIVRLNDGIYHVVSEYGSVNAVIRSDLAVSAGKLTEATIQHRAAQITLKLVAEEGGEAIADTAWSITNSAGDLISESVGAFPSLVLAEGDYTAIARHKEQLFRRDFKVAAGFNYDVEVLLQ